ncbi:MAG TPA: biotin--[acetyl-CoA-carboxylase] ligase, partial [Tepidisphaeraceae bacterium]|nr:biotin--[acetyl-CoA-carboxylase] ligase [Tepidisphaeraceae bacterium]
MRSPADRFSLASLRPQLKPWRLHYFTRLGSTNDHAARLRRDGKLVAPSIGLASRQTRGRGRGSNRWHSPAGCLTVTFALPIDETRLPHQLPLIAGIAGRRAVARLIGSDQLKLKWPNDLLHDDLKLAGLLCERVERVDLIGLGLNVNTDPRDTPSAVRDRVTSLRAITGR